MWGCGTCRRIGGRYGGPVLIVSFPRVRGAPTATSWRQLPAPSAWSSTRHEGHRGRRARGRGARLKPGTSWSPTDTSTTCGASRRWPAATTRPRGSTPRTGTCSATPWPGCPARPRRCSWVATTVEEPDDVRELRGPARADLAGVRFVVDHTPGHTEGLVTFRSPYTGRPGRIEGAVLRRPALRRLIGAPTCRRRPPAMLRSLATKVLAPRRRRRRTARPRRATSVGRERRRTHSSRTSLRPAERFEDDRRGRPLSGSLSYCPAPRRRAAGDRQPVAHLRAARLRPRRTRAVEPLDRLSKGGETSKGDLRAAPAAGRRRRR